MERGNASGDALRFAERFPSGWENPCNLQDDSYHGRKSLADCEAIPDGFGMAMQSARRQTTVSECPCKLQEDFETLPKAQFLRFDALRRRKGTDK